MHYSKETFLTLIVALLVLLPIVLTRSQATMDTQRRFTEREIRGMVRDELLERETLESIRNAFSLGNNQQQQQPLGLTDAQRRVTKDLVEATLNKRLPEMVRTNVAGTLLQSEPLRTAFAEHTTMLTGVMAKQRSDLADLRLREVEAARKAMNTHADQFTLELSRMDENNRFARMIQGKVESRFNNSLIVGMVCSTLLGALGGYLLSKRDNRNK